MGLLGTSRPAISTHAELAHIHTFNEAEIIDETGEVLTPTRGSQAWRASPKVGPT